MQQEKRTSDYEKVKAQKARLEELCRALQRELKLMQGAKATKSAEEGSGSAALEPAMAPETMAAA
jgi:hypothetical protein